LEALNEDLPIDVLPASNGEFLPPPPSREQKMIMQLQSDEIERQRRRFGLSRREFVRTSAAYAIGLWAINEVRGTAWGQFKASAHHTATNKACDLEWPGAQMNNAPGEFIFDIQSHHVEPDGLWRVTNPAMEAFFAGIWSQSGGVTAGADGAGQPGGWLGDDGQGGRVLFRGGREADPIENLSRYHYLKELYLDSSTNMCVLSAVPSDPSNQPLPIQDAARTVEMVNRLAGVERGTGRRAVMHAFVMPNRGSLGTTSSAGGRKPVFQQAEFDQMRFLADEYEGILVGWKTYPAWGDVPYASGWYFDDDLGLAFCEQVLQVSQEFGVPPVIATHKGFALPAFDQRAASPRDIGPAARQYPGVRFVVYHSGFDGGTEAAYPGDDKVNSADRSVNAFVKSLRENRWDASHFIPRGLKFGNVPNVWAEIGSTWRTVMGNTSEAAHLLGKLITHVGPERICWGTDSLWFGSPQSEIVGLRNFEFSEQAKEFYGLPYGLEGDSKDPTRNCQDASTYLSPHPYVADWPTDGKAHPERSIRNAIFGRNAARAYSYGKHQIDPDAVREAISCDRVQSLRDSYLINEATPTMSAPFASNHIIGERTAEGVLKARASGPWAP
jgi:hypothetical protein